MYQKIIFACLSLCLLANSVYAGEFGEQIKTAMADDLRTEKEKARDDNRMPVETLEFLGIESTMRVMELLPGDGWYTKLLTPVLADKGKLYVSMGTGRVKKSLLDLPQFKKVELIDPNTRLDYVKEERLYTTQAFNFPVKNLDAVLTFRNYHNFTVSGRKSINDAVFKSLKPGGIYGVVDHTRRHMEPNNVENRRRADPVLVIKEIQAAGFELVDFSDHLYRSDDELRFEVGRKTVTGNTDRFVLKFIKPQS